MHPCFRCILYAAVSAVTVISTLLQPYIFIWKTRLLRGRYIGVCVRYHQHFMNKYEEVDISAFINVSWFWTGFWHCWMAFYCLGSSYGLHSEVPIQGCKGKEIDN
jgi:hypothetical protein